MRDRFLPFRVPQTIWRSNCKWDNTYPRQGWKIHVSASILTACDTLELVAPHLVSEYVHFKAPNSLEDLAKLNCGLKSGISQVGKFITIYTRSAAQALQLLHSLKKITAGLEGPIIPFDYAFPGSKCLYFRYGVFRGHRKVHFRGREYDSLITPDGALIPDRGRECRTTPRFIPPLITGFDSQIEPGFWLHHHLYPVDVLMKRGKGGVYRALDLSGVPQLCAIKLAYRNGETEWDGRDGFWRLENELRYNLALSNAGISVATVLRTISAGNTFCIVYEYLQGRSLDRVLADKRISMQTRIQICRILIKTLETVHERGFALRDLKPSNVFCESLNGSPKLILLDLEGACDIQQTETFWGTKEYLPKALDKFVPTRWRQQDLYCAACTCIDVLYGKTPVQNRNGLLGRDLAVPPDISAFVQKQLGFLL